MLVGTSTLATTPGFASDQHFETIRASYAEAENLVSVTLIVYNYSISSDVQILSRAFQEGQDRGLATALSKIKAVGQCSITGALSYDVAFIQMVPTPRGRKITFITSRPRPLDEIDPPPPSQSFDLVVGQFELNDTDPTKSTGFLFPAGKLAIDQRGELHYDLAGIAWELVNVVDLPGTPV